MNILVTGGASGVGATITAHLAAIASNKVYFTYFKSEEKARAIEKKFPNALGIACDFSSSDSLGGLLQKMESLDLDILVNSAITFLEEKHFHKLSGDTLSRGFQTNVLPHLLIVQKALPLFRKKRFGKIITLLSSYVANKPPTGLSQYVAEKAYLHSMAKSWVTENSSYNITSNCVAPSIMRSVLTSHVDDRIWEGIEASHPQKKILLPEEVADAVNYLCVASQQINGICLLINGGQDVV